MDPTQTPAADERSKAAARLDAMRKSWEGLRTRTTRTATQRIDKLLVDEPDRLAHFAIDAAGLYVDLSRNLVTTADLAALIDHANVARVTDRRNEMLRGDRVNRTEDRSVLHTLLRAPRDMNLVVDGVDLVAEVHHTLDRMSRFCDHVRSGQWHGSNGKRITDVINIGIGGSQLGPDLACQALEPFADGPQIHFLASLDPTAWREMSAQLDPHSTLVIVASKSWKTPETAQNARAVRDWLVDHGIDGPALTHHCVAVTSNLKGAADFGIPAENVFSFGDWVGGRYSLWSAIGLPIMLAIGPTEFRRMLHGAHQMDRHFALQPLSANAPVLMALVSLWNALMFHAGSEAVVPYSSGLRRLPAYLQQLAMESNGKRVSIDGLPLPWPTAPVTWGEPGSESQHSFFQLLHQGTTPIPIDFVMIVPPADPHGRHISLMASCMAQADALMHGRDLDGARQALRSQGVADAAAIEAKAPHLVYPGNRPTSTILLEKLDAQRFGALIALYEHRTETLGWLWDINSFDQWGVEVGKVRAEALRPLLDSGPHALASDPSTIELARRIRAVLDRT